MKLRPRNKLPVNASSTVPATVPVLPPDTTRPQTPPISELSNAGSTMVREERLSDSSSSVVDDSDMEERMESMPPPTNGRNLKITVPPAAAPLTKNNLKKLSEGISSAVEIGSEGFFSSPMPSPHTRLVQARNFLRAENRNTCLGFAIMLEQIADFLHEIPEDVRGVHDSIYREVKDLLRTHRGYVRAGEQVPSPPRPKRPVTSKNWASRPPKYDGDKDNDKDKDPNDHAEGPLEWTNKINTLIDIIRRDPSAHRPSVVLSHLRDLARPLNKGRLPSADEARRLITERIDKEGGRGGNNKAPDKEMKEEDDDDHDDGAGHHGGSDGKIGSLSGVKRMQLGRGSMMPKEVREWDWERDRRVVLNDYDDQDDEDEVNEDEEEGEGPEAQLLLAETPFLQMLMAGQIRGDLQSEHTNRKDTVEPSVTENGKERVIGMPYKFFLPRPSRERIEEANDIAKALNLRPDPLEEKSKKRKREWGGGMESESEDEGDVRGRGKGKWEAVETEGEELGSEGDEV